MSQSDIEIQIKTLAQLEELNRTVKGMDGLGKEIDQTTRETKELNTQWNSFGHAMKQGLGISVATAAIQGLTSALRQAPAAVLGLVKDYGVQQQAELGLAAAIRAHGGAADELLPRYKSIASAIQSVTTVGDEQTLAMMATATQMGINSGQMEQTIKGAIGLSKAFGLDLTMAARASAAAVQGNTSLLTRYIPALANVSDETEKMRLVSEGMANGYTQATEEAKSATGQMEQLSNTMGDVREKFGEALAGGILPAVKGTKALAEGFQKVPTPVIGAGIALTTAAVAGGGLSLALAKVNVQSLIAAARIGMTGQAALAATPGITAMAGALKGASLAAAAFVGWEVGKAIDQATGASDKLATIWTGLTDKADLSQPLNRTLSSLREQAAAMETLQDKEELRAKAIQFQELATRRMHEALVNGEQAIADQYASQIDGLDSILAALDGVLERNQQRITSTHDAADAEIEVTRELSEQEKLQRLINSLGDDQLTTRQQLLADYQREKDLLDARIRGDEAAITAAEDAIAIERERQQLLRSGVVTAAEAQTAAEGIVRLNRQAQAAEERRREAARLAREAARNAPDGNDDLRTRINLLDQVSQKEQQTKQLRPGVTTQKIRDLSGREITRYMERGKVLGTSDDFGHVGDPIATPNQISNPQISNPPQPAPTQISNPQISNPPQPAPDLTPITQALNAVDFDTSPVTAAIADLQNRFQSQLNDLASQVAAAIPPITQALAAVSLDTSPVTSAIASLQNHLQSQLNDLASQVVEIAN